MRATIAGLPTGIRMMLGLITVGLFLFLGLSFLTTNKILGWALLCLATLRLVVWLRVLGRVLARRAKQEKSSAPPIEPAPWPEDEDESS